MLRSMSFKQNAKKCGIKKILIFMTLLASQRGIILKNLKLGKGFMVRSLFCLAFKLWSSKRQYTCYCQYTHHLPVDSLSQAELRRLQRVFKRYSITSFNTKPGSNNSLLVQRGYRIKIQQELSRECLVLCELNQTLAWTIFQRRPYQKSSHQNLVLHKVKI